MKQFGKIMFSIFIYITYILYSSLIYEGLKYIGIDINLFNKDLKSIILILIDLSLMIILYLIYHKKINSNIKDYKHNFKDYFKLGFKYWLIGISLMIASNFFISLIYTSSSANEEIVQSALVNYPIYMIFSTCLLAPFAEELIFRKSIRDIFNDKYNFIYIIISGLAFGFVHTLAGSSNAMELLYIFPYGIMGSMFAYIYTKTDNILVPITFHLLHNSLMIFISLAL